MCGRFTLFADLNEIVERFVINVGIQEENYSKSYNIAPSHSVLSVINDGTNNRLGYLRWGLLPPWASDEKIGYKLINARAETLSEKPSFRMAYQRKRCLVPANSFFEWKKTDHTKTPLCIKLKCSGLFAMAGLWESWRSPLGKIIHTCTIITTTPNHLVKDIHDRMPVILNPDDESKWLDPAVKDVNDLNGLLKPFPAELMDAYEVSSLVNSPKNNNHNVIQEIC
ncbi:putative SOS response-associated peptidase YedK [Bacillus mesophilus]|uniref:Abasic site processing protein n=1 Tax=Bacillus mesophilus TaxID=1808955 RepID=A0A6M0QC19_9BACI|nr:SOS response-associated peptidase [Bacillus mesophilus]MBM7662047.1 putative SOS response-associated peptidase YedK [Bacillus mesophilus]NEY72598.1 SOS response-associated peptidase [Bacillus mesophilus]